MADLHPILIPFQYSADDNAVIVFDNLRAHIIVGESSITTIESPYTLEQAQHIQYAQSADYIFLANKDVYPQVLIRRNASGGIGILWEIQPLQINSVLDPPSSITITAAYGPDSSATTKTYRYKVSALTEDEESRPSEIVEITTRDMSIIVQGTQKNYITLTWAAVPGATHYSVYREQGGTYGFIGDADQPNDSNQYTFIDDYWDPDMSIAPRAYSDYFQNEGDYPGCVEFHQNSIYWASTYNEPTMILRSQAGQFFNYGQSLPARDDDSIKLVLPLREVNEIRGLVSLKRLIVLTSGDEHTISAANEDGTLTPSNVYVELTGYHGSAAIEPILIGDTILFVDRSGEIVWSLNYSLQSDNYLGDNITIRARHLFADNAITSWTLQRNPYEIIWCVLRDGTVASLTFNRSTNVVAWHTHKTYNGFFRSVVCLRAREGETDDHIYFLVERNINGATRYYLERLSNFFINEKEFKNAFFVDCGITYAGVPVDTIQGLGHLEGQEVDILATNDENGTFQLIDGHLDLDGDPTTYYVLSVSNDGTKILNAGYKDLPIKALELGYVERQSGLRHFSVNLGSVTWANTEKPTINEAAIGLPIESYLQTLPIVDRSGLLKAVADCIFKVNDTVNLEFGRNQKDVDGNVVEYLSNIVDMRESNRLFDNFGFFNPNMDIFSGFKYDVTVPMVDREGSFYIRQTRPYPLSLLLTVITFDTGEM